MIFQTARGSAPEDLIDTAYGDAMITLPMAPSDGLFLDKPSFEKYNERATQAGMGGSLDWEADADGAGSRVPPPPPCVRERILAFKDEHIVDHITREVQGAGGDARRRAMILMIYAWRAGHGPNCLTYPTLTRVRTPSPPSPTTGAAHAGLLQVALPHAATLREAASVLPAAGSHGGRAAL